MSLYKLTTDVKVYVNHNDGCYYYRDCSGQGSAIKNIESDAYNDVLMRAVAEMVLEHLADSVENTYLWFKCDLDLHNGDYNITNIISCNGEKTYSDRRKKAEKYFGMMSRNEAKRIAKSD